MDISYIIIYYSLIILIIILIYYYQSSLKNIYLKKFYYSIVNNTTSSSTLNNYIVNNTTSSSTLNNSSSNILPLSTILSKPAISQINLDNNIFNKNISAYNQNPLDNLIIQSKDCCLIKKEYVPDKDDTWGGKFTYIYDKLKNDKCNPLLYDINSNTQLLFEGENNWNNNLCSDNNNILGSCRNINYECVDFVTKDFCNNMNKKHKTNLIWSTNTCEQPLKFIFDDKVKYNVNSITNYTSVNQFSLYNFNTQFSNLFINNIK